MTSFLGSQDQTWFGSLRSTGGSSLLARTPCQVLASGLEQGDPLALSTLGHQAV
jgi:hypothetical protein